ncbi:MAG: hypothetical protein IPG51_13005 [Chloroflexi bacterium]|nr:hypothetical protein [Chloroflexota bacterium]
MLSLDRRRAARAVSGAESRVAAGDGSVCRPGATEFAAVRPPTDLPGRGGLIEQLDRPLAQAQVTRLAVVPREHRSLRSRGGNQRGGPPLAADRIDGFCPVGCWNIWHLPSRNGAQLARAPGRAACLCSSRPTSVTRCLV